MTDNQLPNAVAQAILRHAQYVLPYMAGVIFVKNRFKKLNIVLVTRFCEFEIIIIMARMGVFLRGWLPHRGKRRWPVITASPRGQCSK